MSGTCISVYCLNLLCHSFFYSIKQSLLAFVFTVIEKKNFLLSFYDADEVPNIVLLFETPDMKNSVCTFFKSHVLQGNVYSESTCL